MASELSSDVTRAKRIVFQLLKFRARSHKEIVDRLRQKKLSKEAIDKTIDYFDKLNLICDKEFASSWLNSRLKKPLGLRMITFELKQKGISQDIIEETKESIKDNYNEYAVVSELAKEKFKKFKGIDSNKTKNRIYSYLMRRGFSPDVVNEVMEEL